MKVTKTVEVDMCDVCNKEESPYYHCFGCGKAICYDCQESHAVRYRHSAFASGAGDGMYCFACDAALKDDPLHMAYEVIARLVRESEVFYVEWRERVKRAESVASQLWEKRRKDGLPC